MTILRMKINLRNKSPLNYLRSCNTYLLRNSDYNFSDVNCYYALKYYTTRYKLEYESDHLFCRRHSTFCRHFERLLCKRRKRARHTSHVCALKKRARKVSLF